MKLLCTLLIAIIAFAPTISAREKEKEGNPLERFKDFHARRSFPYSDIPKDLLGKAKLTMNQMIEKKGGASLLAAQPEWKLLGPTSVGGRIRSASVHPTNPDIVYVGAANGGVWKTTNGGYLWEPLMDFENSSSMGQVVIDPNNPSIIYAATGEDRGGSYGYPGSGIYRSTDEGKSWKLIGLATVGAFMSFKVHPLNSNVLYAGGMNANAGFYRSTDAGATWERTYSKGVRDISIDPKNINQLFIASPGNGVYKSNDGGMTFTYCKMPGYGEGDNLDLAKFGHITVQMAPSNPNIVYSLYEDGENRLGTIVKSTDGGESWVPCFDDLDGTFFNSQGSYDIYISVHPSNPNIVLAGGIDVYRTTNGGVVWDNITRVYTGGNQHPDQHCVTFSPSTNNIVYAGNDGGMMKSEDAGENWETINNQLAITQYHAFGIDQSQSAMAYGGAQDNGTTAVNSVGYGDIVGGDGGFTMVDFVNPNTVYASTQNGNMYRISMNTRQVGRIGASLPADDASLFIAPMNMDPTDSKTLYHGRHALYQSTNQGQTWLTVSPRFSEKISYVGISPLRPEFIAAGTEKGNIHVTTDMGETWTNVTQNGLPTRYITDIEFSREKEETFYITLSGYYTSHVYKTTNLGKTWISISDQLPDISANAIVIHPDNENILFVGTDIGVFATYNGGISWVPFGTKFPNTAVLDMGIYEGRGAANDPMSLRVATHGRAMWDVPLPDDPVDAPEIVNPIGAENYLGGTNQKVVWYGFTLPVRVEYSVDNGNTWNILSDKANGNELRWNIPTRFSQYARIRVTSVDNPDQTRTTRTFTISEFKKGSISQASAVAHLPYGLCYDRKGGLWTTSFSDNYLYKLNAKSLVIEKKIKISEGDSLFSDFTMDREEGVFYVHRLNSTSSGSGSRIVKVDTTGKVLRTFTSPARNYGLGLEYVDGKLLASERDGRQQIYTIDIQSGKAIDSANNPYRLTYGPRCFAFDGDQHLYQICTFFPGGGSLAAVHAVKFSKDNLSKEVDRIDIEGPNGLLNLRGIEYDPEDKNLWVSAYDGAIYKVAGFETKTISSIEEGIMGLGSLIQTNIYPNPANETCFLDMTAPEGIEILHAELFDMMGRPIAVIYDGYVQSGIMKTISFSVKDFPTGMYTLVVGTKDGMKKTARMLSIGH